eukprot:490141_1
METSGFRWQQLNTTGKVKLVTVPIVSTLCLSTLLYIKKLVDTKAIPELNIVGLSPVQKEVKEHLTYNISKTIFALSLLPIIYVSNTSNFSKFFKIGDLSLSVGKSRVYDLLMIKTQNKNWKSFGTELGLTMSFGTAAFLYYFHVRKSKIPITLKKIKVNIPYIVLFSLCTSFTEEIISRFGIISPLYGMINDDKIHFLCALSFGIPHYFGIPGGLLGSVMAAFLGYNGSKAIVETKGIAMAWFIHFIQDVVIYSAMLLTVENENDDENQI